MRLDRRTPDPNPESIMLFLRTTRPVAPIHLLATSAALVALAVGGCTAAPSGSPSSSSSGGATAPASTASMTPTASATSSASDSASPSASAPSSDANTVIIDITIANRQVTPNGQKLDVQVGQTVVLKVTSDQDDEIHAHTGGDGYELAVQAGKPTMGSFTLTSPGSFEIESHKLEKTIAILNAR